MRAKLTDKQFERALTDHTYRVALVKESFDLFLQFYFSSMFTLDLASFHYDIIDVLESDERYITMLGFRGSAKSSFMELYALWVLVTARNNFTVYIKNTSEEAKASVANIKDLLETNELLKKDFGIDLAQRQRRHNEKWSEGQITLGNCTILAKSKGQKIRGAKFKEARIDLIIGDDLEAVEDTRTFEKRKKTREWFFTEVLPATKQGRGSDNVKVVLIGNLVHKDCLIMYLKKSKIVKVLEFPLITEDGTVTWAGKYPTQKDIEDEKAKVYMAGEGLGAVVWAREYLLKLIDEEDQLIKRSEILRYPATMLQNKIRKAGFGNDLAISQKQTADFTAMVGGVDVIDDNGEKKLLILPSFFKKRVGIRDAVKAAKEFSDKLPDGNTAFVEDVAYQKAAIELYEEVGIKVKAVRPVADKRARLTAALYYVKTGRVLFPDNSSVDELIDNIIGFGIEAHDDLVDAFVMLVLGICNQKTKTLAFA